MTVVDGPWTDDPFRDLEERRPDVGDWQDRLDVEAQDVVRGLPGYRAVHNAVERHLDAGALSAPIAAGSRWFYSDGDAIRVSRHLGAAGEELVRSDCLAAGANPRIDWVLPHPDGSLVAVGASHGGDEQSVLHIIDALAGTALGPQVPYVWGDAVAWLPGSRRLIALAGGVPGPRMAPKTLLEATPGAGMRRLSLPFRGEALRHALQVSPDGRYLAILEQPAAPRLTQVLDRVTGEWVIPPPLESELTLHGVFAAGDYWAVTTAGAPRGRLIRAKIEDIPRWGAWEPVVPERREVLRAVAAMGEVLVLCYFDRGASRLRLLALDGSDLEDVPLPDAGLCATNGRAPGQYGGAAPVRADRGGLTFTFASVGRSPGLMRYDAGSRRTRWVRKPAVALDEIRTAWLSARGDDGAEIPCTRVWRGAADGPKPTLIAVYGGWNAMTSARGYLGAFAPFVEAGGEIVFAHVRGDATFGADQWRGGRRRAKRNGVADLCAVAETLIARRIAAPARLGLWGASNGGLLVGGALTQRPELFRVAVAVVPVFDLCRFMRDPFGVHAAWEYGHPGDPDDAEVLLSYSPYHKVAPGTRYPATLVVCGENDVRAPAWHGRKMVAALRRATAGGEPALLRVHRARGHVTAGEEAPAWLVAEWLAYVMDRLGLEPAR